MEGSDVILGTSVTWAEFETNLRDSLGTKAKFGHNKAVFDIGDGQGFASKTGLITCDWINVSADEKLPAKVIVKIPSLLGIRKLNDEMPEGQKMFNFDEAQWAGMEAQMAMIHNTEVASYDFLSQFEGCLVPKKYYGSPVTDGGQLCLSYYDNSRTMNFYERHTVDQVKQIARALGKIQACSLQKEVTSPDLGRDMFGMLKEFFPLETYRGMFKGILALDSSDKTQELMEQIDALVLVYHGSNVPTSIHKQMGFRPVIVNGDLHTGNVLIDKDSGDLLSLIDWQCAHVGVGVEDLHRLAMSALPTEERREAMPMLVKEMYDSMIANLDGAEPPYTLETLLLVSDLVYVQCALFLVGPLIAFMMKNSKDATLSDEEKASRKEVMLEKAIGILEDVVEIDIKNNNNNNKGDVKLVFE